MRLSSIVAVAALTVANAAVTLAPASAGPADLALAKPACAFADRLPSFVAPPAEWPSMADLTGAAGSAEVLVSIPNSVGAPLDAQIHASSGNRYLDAEALRVAHAARFSPALSNCRNAGGSYLMTVTFAR